MKKQRVTIIIHGDFDHSECMYIDVDLHIGSD